MRYIKIGWFYFKYCIYLLLTLEARNKYQWGKMKGYNCTNIESGLFTITARFENKKPRKEYVSFKEYKEMYYPKISA